MVAHKFAVLCSISTLALVSACSSPPPRSDYGGNAPGVAVNATQYGTVSAIDVIPVAARTSGGGAVLGAVLGAVIGHQVGSGTGRDVATGVGAVGGAVIGNTVERHNKSDSEIYRVSVRLQDRSTAVFDYQRIDDLRVGDRVRIEGGQLVRF